MNVKQTSIMTLFQGDYYLGAGALINSLVQSNFSGNFIAYVNNISDLELQVQDQINSTKNISLSFVKVEGERHFAFAKPNSALEVLHQTNAENLLYFDPDIIVTAPFQFFQSWSRFGIGLVEEIQFFRMSEDHPIRKQWGDWAASHSLEVRRNIGKYFNSGFFSIGKKDISWLKAWSNVLELLDSEGQLDPHVDRRRYRPFATWDQDAMNLSLMLCDNTLSTMGPEAMGFTGTSIVMLHATGPKKPWRKRFISEALKGNAPTLVDRAWLANTQGPIEVLSKSEFKRKSLEIKIASAIGRFIRRS